MKKVITLIIVIALILGNNSQAKIQDNKFHAVVTFFWKSEDGGKYSCDGTRLQDGDAAVDFDVIPKGSILNLGNIITVKAIDMGGSAVVSRKAARERGYHCPVIDVWEPSKAKAMLDEAKLPKVVTVTIEGNVFARCSSKKILFI